MMVSNGYRAGRRVLAAFIFMLSPLGLGLAAQSAPDRTLQQAGLQAPVEIRVDRWGVSHIYAQNEADLFFAQGFNAARDRLFQIDLWRRRGLGQLSEVFGAEFVEQDRAARLFLYRGDMGREWEIYGAHGGREAEAITQRFVTGINAYIDWLQTHPEYMPWEFKALDYRPAKWAAEDVVRIRSHGLTRNLTSEVARANSLCKTGDVTIDQIRFGLSNGWKAQPPEGLDPCLPADILKVFQLATRELQLVKPPMVKPLEKAAQAISGVKPPQLASLWEEVESTEGSNNWVVSPAKSATGRAIMANDPHRAYSTPGLRYIVHLSSPQLDVIGAGEPALPGIALGHNNAIAFGLTIFNIDQEDLYVYQLNPANPAQYKYEDGWEAVRSITETIAVKGAPDQTVTLQFTRHGPVIFTDLAKSRAYAVRSGWLEAGTSPYFGSLHTMRAQSFSAFQQSLVNWGAPTLNQVYADTKGNIGWVASGLAPKRPNWDGLLPVPGDGRYEWGGFWRGNDMPSSYNPAQGWIATANGYNIPDNYPARERKLGFEWTNPSRLQRLGELLGATPKVSLEDSEKFQGDMLSIPARRLVALLASLKTADEKTARALALLRGWDARLVASSPQAALEEVWQLRHLRKAFREAVLPPAAASVLAATDMNVMLENLEDPKALFGMEAAAKRDRLLMTSLKAAWEEMEKLQGAEPALWQWGRLHYNLSEHPFAPVVSDTLRAWINIGPVAKGGSEFTPNQSLARPSDFRQMNGPSVRLVVDVGQWDNSRAVNYPGQSGDPDSPHYRDLVPLWRDGRYFPLAYSRKAVESVTESIIRLAPARSGAQAAK